MDINGDRGLYVALSSKVEEMLQTICVEQNQQPASPHVRRQLENLGEEGALKVLRKIRGQTIKKNLNACILYFIKKDRTGGSDSPSPAKVVAYTPDRRRQSCATNLTFNMQDCGSNGATSIGNRFSPQLEALSTLEFRKQFIILSYIGTQKLEDVVSVDLIRELKDHGMIRFEEMVWEVLGSAYINKEDRCKNRQWNSGNTLIYHCHVSPDGSYRFKGPYFSPLKTLLQKKIGDDNVLLVKLAEEVNNRSSSANTSRESSSIYNTIAKEGIYVGLRRYRFFVFKDGGKEEKKKDPTSSSVKCYFVSLEGNELLADKTIQEARSFFMHAHTVSSLSNYMIRLSLILSKTVSLEVDFNDVKVERIDDIECKDENGITLYDNKGKPLIYTDGTGYVSPDIAVKCSGRIYKGKCTHDQEIEPLLIQCRLFYEGLAVKGTLLVNKKLDKTIQVRPSMIKVEKDPKLANYPSVNSLEIVGTSNKPKSCYLSKNLILLLSFGGVPNEYFLDLLENALTDAHGVFSSKKSALKVAINHGDMDDLNAARMILSGIPLEESYLQYHLSILMKEEKKSLKGAKIPVPDSYYLMGTADPTGCLKKDEVCIILDSGQISGNVLVYRNPGLHVGDVHVLKAKYVEELELYVGNSKFGIFFPCIGPRSLADEIAGGDFDGDMYWVSRNPQLLEFFKPSQPWKSASKPKDVRIPKPSDFSSEQLEDELISLWLGARFNPSYTVGVAADSWMALMDRYLTIGDTQPEEKKLMEENILKLIDLYYDALDQPKKGGEKIEVPSSLRADVFPHYMGKDQSVSYLSKSILGLIFDRVESFQILEEDQSKNVMVWRLPCFDVAVPRDTVMKWGALYEEYRKDMTVALSITGEGRRESLDEVVKNYKRKLYDAEDFEDSPRSMDDIMDDAIAIYTVCYDYADKVGKVGMCNFAWKVAGSALCKHYMNPKREKVITCAPSVLREIYS